MARGTSDATKLFAAFLGGTLKGGANAYRDKVLLEKNKEGAKQSLEYWEKLLNIPDLTPESRQRIAGKIEDIVFGVTPDVNELQLQPPQQSVIDQFKIPIQGVGDVPVSGLPKPIQEDYFREKTGIIDPAEQALVESRKATARLTGKREETEGLRQEKIKKETRLVQKKINEEGLTDFGKKQGQMFNQLSKQIGLAFDELKAKTDRWGNFNGTPQEKQQIEASIQSLKYQLNQVAMSVAPQDYMKMAPQVLEIYVAAFGGDRQEAFRAFSQTPMGQESAK